MTPTTMSLPDRYEIKRLGFAADLLHGSAIGCRCELNFSRIFSACDWLEGMLLFAWQYWYFVGAVDAIVKDTPRKTVTTKAPKQSFLEIITLLFKVLRSSKSLVLIILAGTIYHVLLGASVFDQVWAIEDKVDRATFAQDGLIFTSLVFWEYLVAHLAC